MSDTQSPFYIPVDLSATALIISDVQTQILGRFPKQVQEVYLAALLRLVEFLRVQIAHYRTNTLASNSSSKNNNINNGIPLIVHHTLAFNINRNAFISPYNKLAKWVQSLEAAGYFSKCESDPYHPSYAIPSDLMPKEGWCASPDELYWGSCSPTALLQVICSSTSGPEVFGMWCESG